MTFKHTFLNSHYHGTSNKQTSCLNAHNPVTMATRVCLLYRWLKIFPQDFQRIRSNNGCTESDYNKRSHKAFWRPLQVQRCRLEGSSTSVPVAAHREVGSAIGNAREMRVSDCSGWDTWKVKAILIGKPGNRKFYFIPFKYFSFKQKKIFFIFFYFRKLSLSTNMVDKITGLNGMRNLKILSIGRNYIKTISGLVSKQSGIERDVIDCNL